MTESIWRGQLVELRAKTPADIPRYLADGVVDDMRLYGDGYVPFPMSIEQRRASMERDIESDKGEACSLAIANFDGELVGAINTYDCDSRSGTFSYGVAIFDVYRRRGYAADAIRVLLRYYFEERHYFRAGAKVYSFNEPSLALQSTLGFEEEGRLRQVVFTRGQRYDLVLFGLLASEFNAP